jgi:hypothetical protein
VGERKKIGIVQCRPSWGESEIKINKCEWKKMEERSHVKAKNNMEAFVLN